jgi:hypothetical protein
MRIIIKLTACCSLLTFLSFGQSKLIFQNAKDSTNTYQLPLGKFPVQLKLKDTLEFNSIIDNYADSVLNIRQYSKSKTIDSAIAILKASNIALIKTEPKKKDSLNIALNKNINALRYSIVRSIEIPRIKTITIYNHYYPAFNKKIKLTNAACAVFLTGTLVVSRTKNPYLIGSGIGLTALAFIVKSAIATKDLHLIVSKRARLTKKWKPLKAQE